MADFEITQLHENETIPFQYSITSYGADYPVDSIVKRLRDKAILIPEFQRKYVWSIKDASRFIESLLLGLPVPGVFFSKESDTGKLLVIDGQQRLLSLLYFYDGIFGGKEFRLTGVDSEYKGKTYKTLAPEDRLRLDDSIIHATVVRQDEPSEDLSSIYHIFERLNAGGKLLQPQEIRAAIYHGQFSDLLSELNKDKNWREIFGKKPNPRLRDQELILRFLALYFDVDSYKAPMKSFLNAFMGKHRNLDSISKFEIKEIFISTVEVVNTCISPEKPFRPEGALNAAIFDAVMFGLAQRLKDGPVKDCEAMVQAYRDLLQDSKFVDATKKATANEVNLRERLRLATEAFQSVK
ncbi:MAG: DUF262 domain-containing protein [Trueperaceae bacterium]|nr:DUF262 domain-containing protein [Trueperaceae bacterium]